MSSMTVVGREVPPPGGAQPGPGERLFADVLVGSRPYRWTRRQRIGTHVSFGAHLVAVALVVLVPILLPARLPEQTDYIRALLYDPPPPPPPPLTRGSSLREPLKPETPKPVVQSPRPTFTAPIETPRPVETAKVEEAGIKPEDQFGSENGSDLFGDPMGMEEGVEGGVVGGVPGGVLGGVIGGTGTGPVLDYDAGPSLIKQTKPRYPQEAFVKKIEGRVLVEILIDAQGRVARARVIKSVPLLDAAALQCVYEWIFRPAMQKGHPVPTIAHAPVDFRIY
jgi:protein TonB